MFKELRAQGEAFSRYKNLLKYLVERDFKVKYRRSVLGIMWSLLNPILMALLLGLVFQGVATDAAANNALPLVISTQKPPVFLIYVMSGQTILNFFNEATSTAMDSVLGSATLIKKVYIPKYIFPMERVIFSSINLLFTFAAYMFMIIVTGSPITLWFLLAPLVFVLLAVFNFGVGLFLSAAVVFFRDVKHFYGIITYALSFLTPIFMTENQLGNVPIAKFIMRINPIYWYTQMFRQLTVYGAPPTLYQWVATVFSAIGALIIGVIVFKKTQDNFILHV